MYIMRSRRGEAKIIEYYADDLCKEAEGTIFANWRCYWNRENSIAPDINVTVEDYCYPLHSCILKLWSKYFENSLPNHSPDFFVMLPNVKRCDFNVILQFMYEGVLRVSEDRFTIVLSIANHLEIDSFVKLCGLLIIHNLREEVFDIARIIEFLCNPTNRYSSKIIIPQLLKRWDVFQFQSIEVMRSISFDMLKIMITSNIIPRFNDKDIVEVCCRWISADIEHRFFHVMTLLKCITGKPNDELHSIECSMPRNGDDVEQIFNQLLECNIQKDKIDFLSYLGLVMNRDDHAFHNDRVDETMPSIKLFYFEAWKKQMKILRHNEQSGDIVVQVNSDKEYLLDYWVLCLSSEFFQDLDPNLRHYVQLHLSNEEFTSVLNFMYGKALNITPENIINVLRASRFLKIDSCRRLILKFIRNNISSLDLIELLNVSSEKLDKVNEFVKHQIVKNFTNVKKYSIFCLKFECLRTLISSKSLKLDIKDRLSLCYDWIAHDIKKRLPFASELIDAVSFLEDYNNVEALSNELNRQLKQKLYSDLSPSHEFEELQFGKAFTVNIPRIKLPTPRTLAKVIRENSQFGKPFCISIPRSKIVL